MHQDQGDASQVNRAYAYPYGRLYIYGPLALEIERTNQLNQEVTEPSKVTPLSPGTELRTEDGPLLSQHDATLYQSIVGSIMYLMLATRPDFSYAVGAVSLFSSTPSSDHLAALHDILRHIPGSADLQLYLMRCSAFEAIPKATPLTKPHYPNILWDSEITGYCDSDWVGCLDLCHSTGAYIFLSGQLAVSWSRKK